MGLNLYQRVQIDRHRLAIYYRRLAFHHDAISIVLRQTPNKTDAGTTALSPVLCYFEQRFLHSFGEYLKLASVVNQYWMNVPHDGSCFNVAFVFWKRFSSNKTREASSLLLNVFFHVVIRNTASFILHIGDGCIDVNVGANPAPGVSGNYRRALPAP